MTCSWDGLPTTVIASVISFFDLNDLDGQYAPFGVSRAWWKARKEAPVVIDVPIGWLDQWYATLLTVFPRVHRLTIRWYNGTYFDTGSLFAACMTNLRSLHSLVAIGSRWWTTEIRGMPGMELLIEIVRNNPHLRSLVLPAPPSVPTVIKRVPGSGTTVPRDRFVTLTWPLVQRPLSVLNGRGPQTCTACRRTRFMDPSRCMPMCAASITSTCVDCTRFISCAMCAAPTHVQCGSEYRGKWSCVICFTRHRVVPWTLFI